MLGAFEDADPEAAVPDLALRARVREVVHLLSLVVHDPRHQGTITEAINYGHWLTDSRRRLLNTAAKQRPTTSEATGAPIAIAISVFEAIRRGDQVACSRSIERSGIVGHIANQKSQVDANRARQKQVIGTPL
jgi:hypothetical protein